jgi:hypothetical protein
VTRLPHPSIALLVLALIATAGCGNSRTVAQRLDACPLAQRDSALLDGGPVYRDCAVEVKAKFIASSATRIDYSPPTGAKSSCSSVEVQMVVDTAGKPEVSTVQVFRANDRPFADAVLATAGSWRFEPAMLQGARVRQIVVEKRTVMSMLVAVPAGQGPPRSPSRGQRPVC